MRMTQSEKRLRAKQHLDRIEEALQLAAAKYALNDITPKDVVPNGQMGEARTALKALWLLAGMEAPLAYDYKPIRTHSDRFRDGCSRLITGVTDIRALMMDGREDLARLILPRAQKGLEWLSCCCLGLKASNEKRAAQARIEGAA